MLSNGYILIRINFYHNISSRTAIISDISPEKQ